ncbi:hypothetical protein Tco_0573316 [Tanacetum coccineum]
MLTVPQKGKENPVESSPERETYMKLLRDACNMNRTILLSRTSLRHQLNRFRFIFLTRSCSRNQSKRVDTFLRAKDLARPPTLLDVLHSSLQEAKTILDSSNDDEQKEEDDQSSDSNKREMKLKLDPEELCEDIRKSSKGFGKLIIAKNIAISMTKKAGFLLGTEKSIKSSSFVLCKKDAVFLKRKIEGFVMVSLKAFHQRRTIWYLSFGRHLKELHVTLTHLEKKRTRLRTYTNIDQEFLYSGRRRRHRYNVTPSPRRS